MTFESTLQELQTSGNRNADLYYRAAYEADQKAKRAWTPWMRAIHARRARNMRGAARDYIAMSGGA